MPPFFVILFSFFSSFYQIISTMHLSKAFHQEYFLVLQIYQLLLLHISSSLNLKRKRLSHLALRTDNPSFQTLSQAFNQECFLALYIYPLLIFLPFCLILLPLTVFLLFSFFISLENNRINSLSSGVFSDLGSLSSLFTPICNLS